jgi:signal transduction histidine kinase
MAQTMALDGGTTTGGELAPTEPRSGLASARALLSLASALIVCILAVLAVRYLRGPGPVAALWGASGVAVAGWLNGPRGREFDLAYGLLVTAAFAISGFLIGNNAYDVFVLTLASVIEVGAAVWLIRRFTPATAPSLLGIMKFLLAAPVIAPFVSGLVAAAAIAPGSHRSFLDLLICWQLGHGLGLAVIGPLGMQLARGRLSHLPKLATLIEGAIILGACAVVSFLVFFGDHRPIGFLSVPLILLAAVRLRLPGASFALLIVTVIAITGTLYGGAVAHPEFPETLEQKIRVMQLYLVFSAVPALPVAALLDERDRLAERARAGQRAAEAASLGKSRLLANVSHEIKSPVAGIIGIGELWSAGRLGPVNPMQQEMAEMLVRTARQVEALAYDLLDVSQAEAGSVAVRLAPVELWALLEDVRRTVAMKPEAQALRIVVERGPEDVRAMADSVRLTQVVTNLAVNAVKYGGSGGIVILKLERPAQDRVRLVVIDKGPGIPYEKQGELFEPFNRLGMEKTTIEGNGIGLTLAKRLTELQGGAIGFDSRPGEGSRFWVDLPTAA